ncbi:D-alanyl-D-alanine carboxypeptidase, partial [Acinetobacter baumannii]
RLGLSSLWLALLASSAAPVVHAQGLPPSVVGALRVAHIPQQNTGVVVVDADNGKRMLAANNTGQPFNPASVMKLVTTDVALEILGPTYTW